MMKMFWYFYLFCFFVIPKFLFAMLLDYCGNIFFNTILFLSLSISPVAIAPLTMGFNRFDLITYQLMTS